MTSGSQPPPRSLIKSRHRGKVVVAEPDVVDWVKAPPFTGDLKHAKSLIPDGLHTIASASEACAVRRSECWPSMLRLSPGPVSWA